MIIQSVIGIFLLLEFANVLALYFKPDFPYANAMGVFKQWEKSRTNDPVADLLRYLAFWVAGSKLIFILLLLVIAVFGNETIQLYSLFSLILAILTYFWKLSPLIRKMDRKGQISPKGYSKILDLMILSFILVMTLAIALHLAFGW